MVTSHTKSAYCYQKDIDSRPDPLLIINNHPAISGSAS